MKSLIKKLFFIGLIIIANSTQAIDKISLTTSLIENQLNVIIHHTNKNLHCSHKISSNYLIINFNKPVEYRLNNKVSSIKTNNFAYRSFDKKTIFIKLHGKFIDKGQYNIKNSIVLNLLKIDRKNIEVKTKLETLNSMIESKAKLENTNLSLSKVQVSNSDANYITLSFNWPEEVGCAAFSIGRYSWITFSKKKEFDLSQLNSLGIFDEIKDISNTSATIFRIKHSLSGEHKAEKHDNTWNITFARNTKEAILPGSLINETTSLNSVGRVFDARFPSSYIYFKEEITGEDLIIITLTQSDIGVMIPRNFIDYNLLKSAQGMILSQLNEDIKIKLHDSGVEIISPNYAANINLYDKINQKTREILKNQAKESDLGRGNNYTMLPFLEKEEISDANFVSQYHKILSDISVSDSANINRKRYELAKFYFLNALYPEAVSILKTINEAAPTFMVQQPSVRFMQAVSLTLAGRYDEAEKLYRNLKQLLKDKKNLNEIEIWLNLNNFLNYNTNHYIGMEDHEDDIIFAYPENIYWKILLPDIEIAIKNNNLVLADRLFANMHDFPKKDFKLTNDIKYLRAKYYINNREYEKAKLHLNALKIDNRDPYNQIRANIELIKLQLALKEIEDQQAISQLNSLKQVWRGDFVEYDLLMLLAKLYRENNDAINALRTYKYIVESSTLKTDQLFITAEMIGLFNKIFSPGGDAEIMNDFDTVSLFYEFKELTPIGSAGDNVVLHIVSRLVNLDLLETAEALLNHQISYRLIGDKRVNVGDQLAYIYLMNKKPQLAIETIEHTDKDNFTYSEHLKRVQLKAKAYSDLHNYDYALRLIKDDKTLGAGLLREEIYFKTQDWINIINILEPEIITKISTGETFYDTDEIDVTRLLVAYAMQDNKDKLKFLKNNLKTNSIELQNLLNFFGEQTKTIDYKNLENSLDLKNLESFLDNIKKDLFNNNIEKPIPSLPATNPK